MGEGQGINIITGNRGIDSYTRSWLTYMAQWSGMDKEDVELISICDVDDINLLFKPKTRPIRIIGGSDAFNDMLYMPFADALCIGEGFEFFRDYRRFGSLEKVFEQPYMLTPDKEEVISSTYVDWKLAPPIRTGKHKVMILGGRGCKNKCKFCYTSWTTKYQQAEQQTTKINGMVVNVITNDSEGDVIDQKVAVRSITVKRYLAMTKAEAKNCRFYRFGLESFTEQGRAFFNKPISSEELKAVCGISKMMNHDIQFFVIMGLEPQESILEFYDAVGYDVAKKPRIIMNGNYFNPCLHTPLQDYDIRKLHTWNRDWLYGKMTEYGGRYRTIMAQDAGIGLYRGLIRRCRNAEETRLMYKMKGKKRAEIEEYVEKNNLGHLWVGAPPTKVRFNWRKQSSELKSFTEFPKTC